MIRTGERSALVEGSYELSTETHKGIKELLDEAGIEDFGVELVIRREVHESGRTRVFINDQISTASTLKSLQPFLIEIHGQGETQTLLAPHFQLDMLDTFAGCVALRHRVATAYAKWKRLRDERAAVQRNLLEQNRAKDFLEYQLAEVEALALRHGEDEELTIEKALLSHAEKAIELSSSAYTELYESDDSLLSRLASVRRRVHELSGLDQRADSPLATTLESIQSATLALTDAAETLRGYSVSDGFSPLRLNEIEERLAALEKLKRKYVRSLDELIAFQDELRAQLHAVAHGAEREDRLRRELDESAEEYAGLALSLSKQRRAAAADLAERVTRELTYVAMERARFTVAIETAAEFLSAQHAAAAPHATLSAFDDMDGGERAAAGGLAEAAQRTQTEVVEAAFNAFGVDRVEFMLAANSGERARPLPRVASGGELSRLMLALRTVCNDAAAGDDDNNRSARLRSATLVFDEIDAGISGRVAEAVGRRLVMLGRTQQILCVTHQPQIARFADHHFVVSKRVEAERTVAAIKQLEWNERVDALASLISGTEASATAYETARWLLETAKTTTTATTATTTPAPRRSSFRRVAGSSRKLDRDLALKRRRTLIRDCVCVRYTSAPKTTSRRRHRGRVRCF